MAAAVVVVLTRLALLLCMVAVAVVVVRPVRLVEHRCSVGMVAHAAPTARQVRSPAVVAAVVPAFPVRVATAVSL